MKIKRKVVESLVVDSLFLDILEYLGVAELEIYGEAQDILTEILNLETEEVE